MTRLPTGFTRWRANSAAKSNSLLCGLGHNDPWAEAGN